MWRHWSPWIDLPIDERQAIIGDVIPSVLVDDLGIRWGGDVEGFPADDLFVRKVDQSRDERELVLRNTTTGL